MSARSKQHSPVVPQRNGHFLSDLSMLMLTQSLLGPHCRGSVQQEHALCSGTLLGASPGSQLQLRGAHQAQGSGFFWSQATLQGPSHCSA